MWLETVFAWRIHKLTNSNETVMASLGMPCGDHMLPLRDAIIRPPVHRGVISEDSKRHCSIVVRFDKNGSHSTQKTTSKNGLQINKYSFCHWAATAEGELIHQVPLVFCDVTRFIAHNLSRGRKLRGAPSFWSILNSCLLAGILTQLVISAVKKYK